MHIGNDSLHHASAKYYMLSGVFRCHGKFTFRWQNVRARLENMKKLTKITLLLGCSLIPAVLMGQFETAEVLGTVRDNTDSAVPKATVTLLNQDTGIEAKTSTDQNGS